MKVILLNLPWRSKGRLGVRAGSRWPFTSPPEEDGRIYYIPFPFFLAYATSLLKKEKEQVKLIDAIAEEIDEQALLEKLKSYEPTFIVAETSTPSFENDLRIIRNIYNNLPDCRIAVCGPHASVFPEQILKDHDLIDYVLIGEYEYTLLELVRQLENNLSLGPVSGLAYRDNQKIRINHPRPTIDNLDILPWPEREDVPIYKYNDGFAGLPVPNVQIWTSRGCPFRCSFCLWPQTIYREYRYRKRDPEDVVDEMEYLLKRFNFKAIFIDDDVFNIDRGHVLNICKEIIERKIRIPWAAMARADLMDEELLENLVRAGLYAIKYGVESANPDILKSCKKNMDLDKTYKMVKSTKKMGIKVHLTFCLGLPGETKGTAQETISFIQDTRPDSLQVSFAIPFPGTEYFRYVKDKGWLLSEDWSDYDGNDKCIVETEELGSKDLEELRIALNNSINP